MEKVKTYFEQIPVEIVKKIAREIPARNEIEDLGSGDGASFAEGWRGVAERVLAEPDPNKMIELVQELVKKYDEEKLPGNRSTRDGK